MKLAGTYNFDAPRKVVWDALMDPKVIASVLPDCDGLKEVGQDEYETTLNVKVGPVGGKFKGSVKVMDINEPTDYRMQVNGRGPSGFMKGVGEIRLEEQGDSTLLHYAGDAQVGGRIASVGQRLIDSSAKAMTRQSLNALAEQVKALIQPPAQKNETDSSMPGEAVSTPRPKAGTSTGEFAFGIAKTMLEDAIPPARRPTLIAAGFIALALFLFLNWWANVVARKVADEIWERR